MAAHRADGRLPDHDPCLRAQRPEQMNRAVKDESERVRRMVIVTIKPDQVDIPVAWPERDGRWRRYMDRRWLPHETNKAPRLCGSEVVTDVLYQLFMNMAECPDVIASSVAA